MNKLNASESNRSLHWKATFAWEPRWRIETVVEKVVEWSKAWRAGENIRQVMDRQIEAFLCPIPW